VREPFPANVVRQHILAALSPRGHLFFSKHAMEEMQKDELLKRDVRNVLRSGIINAGEKERGSYRYRVHTSKGCAVVAVRSETEVVVVTAWRFR
jgi:Domain of unknown function (DUF4258)